MKMIAAVLLALVGTAAAQFEILDAKTTASLRGVDAVSAQVAWASGSGGTILLTTDGGTSWKHCATPQGGEKLDFRGVQAFDAQIAVVMASGKGPASAIYRTTDGCATWKPVFANPDAEGFFDGLHKVTDRQMYLMGDPVDGKFAMFYSPDKGETWYIADDPGLEADKGEAAFAASNTSLNSVGPVLYLGTGGMASHVYNTYGNCAKGAAPGAYCPLAWQRVDVPAASGSDGAGIFSLAGRSLATAAGKVQIGLVAVGGDYQKADASTGTASFSLDGKVWVAATTPPHGYRSAVAFQSASLTWIAVGPNGCDTSKDDGRNWMPLAAAADDAANADKGWNAISLPFVVGGRGKIGKLKPGVLAK